MSSLTLRSLKDMKSGSKGYLLPRFVDKLCVCLTFDASGGGVFSRDAQTVMSYLSGWLGTLCYGKYDRNAW